MMNKAKYSVQLVTLSLLSLSILTGCNAIKNLADKKEQISLTATKTDAQYYQNATIALEKRQYTQAKSQLNDLRTFYPTSRYAEQALLDLIYIHYQSKDYEMASTTATQFINTYPNSAHLDYAVYARAVTYMRGSPKMGMFFKVDQSERDTSFLRLAFSDLQSLVTLFPNSIYAPDASLRMTDIYNQFAHHEIQAARWYIKRQAYVAAANRARWVFQYYPQSKSIPEAIAILAYSNEKLGLTQTAKQYKTLLQINYPQYLNGNQVILPNQTHDWGQKALSMITLGRYGQSKVSTQNQATNYRGETQTQIIQQAQSLQLAQNTRQSMNPNLPNHQATAPNQDNSLADETMIDLTHTPSWQPNANTP